MKPIPDDAPPELARLAELLRDVCLAAGGRPLAAIAERAGVPKSTLRHALGGERLPNMETVLGLVAACQDPAVEAIVRQDERMRAAVLWREAYRAVNAGRLGLPDADETPRELAVANRLIQGYHGHPPPADRASARHGSYAARTRLDSAADVDGLVRLREERLAAEAAFDAAVERLGEATAAVAVARAALRAATAAERDATAAGARPSDAARGREEG
ncbi:hypothetical protein OG311_03300 [Streptomyces sp. NBC_01343]|uniref:hypothetical protein n=1 Tax=Streptomyces sp. NBC_01343 TaxID=2903832 RepID=UPI002E0F57EC|nr:hypothetical protein OG311_03300 [Streptomyces sp. NBC_01343]